MNACSEVDSSSPVMSVDRKACEQYDQMTETIQQGDAERAAGGVGEHFELSGKRMAEYATPVGIDIEQ